MKIRSSLGLVSFLLIVFSHSTLAGSPVWKIEKNGYQLFIGGTIHMLAAADYPLPDAFDKAYRQSAQLVLETDMQKLQSPEFQVTMMRELTYSNGRNLKQVLNRDTYAALEQFFATRGVPMASIVNFKPGLVVTMMTVLEMQRLGLGGVGVDAYFSARAIDDRKKLGQLETVEAQIAFLAGMGAGQEDEMLRFSLDEVEQLPVLMKSIKAAWRRGDMKKIKELGISSLKKDFPRLHKELLVDRNNAWIPQIEAMLKTTEVELVLVGALHLAGEDGLLAQLSARGYKINML
ncbi:MAG: TraB/GumN family protein [Gammaproteobacteria bacterium]|nr:TraB/GumN family protein [Gammaproteobacteria bacterium]